jgi:outer membrane lipoprotein SlyB
MTTRFRIALAVLCALSVIGCATQRTVMPSAVVTSQQSKPIPAARVKDAVVVGQSTRADVVAALGEPLVIRFDNGFEVWVYRLADDTGGSAAAARRMAVSRSERPGPGTSAEFVILFPPSGVVAKTRIRPA